MVFATVASCVVRLAELFRLGLATAVVSVERRGGDNLEGWLQRLEHHGVRCETVTESARAHCYYSSFKLVDTAALHVQCWLLNLGSTSVSDFFILCSVFICVLCIF